MNKLSKSLVTIPIKILQRRKLSFRDILYLFEDTKWQGFSCSFYITILILDSSFKYHNSSWALTFHCLYIYSHGCACLVTQLCLTLCDPMDYSMPGFLSPGVCSNSCPLCRWCHPITSFSVTSCPQSFPASGSFPMSWLVLYSRSFFSILYIVAYIC